MTLWTGEFATLCAGVCTHVRVCVCACVRVCVRVWCASAVVFLFNFLVLKLIRMLLVILGL